MDLLDVRFALTIVNVILATALAIVAVRAARHGGGSMSRTLRRGLAIVGIALLLTVLQRMGIHLARLGLLSKDVDQFLRSWFQLILSLTTTALALGGLWVVLGLLREMSEREAVLDQLVERLPPDSMSAADRFTPRERDVLLVLARGKMTDQDIADELVISPHTAATHIRNMLKKTGLHERRQLVLLGQQYGVEEATEGR